MGKIKLVILSIVLIAFVLTALPLEGINASLKLSRDEKSLVALTLWHVDSFSGGKNSRARHLTKLAGEYSKMYGVLVVVKTVTSDTLSENLAAGAPDLLSFGTGDGKTVEKYLTAYGGAVSVRDEFRAACEVNGSLLAVPLFYGGYFLLGEGETITFSGENVSPLLSAVFSDVKLSVYDYTRLAAYEKYLSGKCSLLCTQREVARTLARISDGRSSETKLTPLAQFTDQIQAIGVTKNCKYKDEAEGFIELLTSDKAQTKVAELYMFPCVELNVYSIEPFSSYEKSAREIAVMPLFSGVSEREDLAKKALCGDKAAVERIYGMAKNG